LLVCLSIGRCSSNTEQGLMDATFTREHRMYITRNKYIFKVSLNNKITLLISLLSESLVGLSCHHRLHLLPLVHHLPFEMFQSQIIKMKNESAYLFCRKFLTKSSEDML